MKIFFLACVGLLVIAANAEQAQKDEESEITAVEQSNDDVALGLDKAELSGSETQVELPATRVKRGARKPIRRIRKSLARRKLQRRRKHARRHAANIRRAAAKRARHHRRAAKVRRRFIAARARRNRLSRKIRARRARAHRG